MKKFFNSLFWEIATVFLFILLITTVVHSYIFVDSANKFFQETRQYLDHDIAEHIASENECFIGDSVNSTVLKEVFHDVMIVNPSIEVYLLDRDGKILTYYAPNRNIRIDYVPLNPIQRFVSAQDRVFITGVDPKDPTKQKIFSAAEVLDEGILKGYIYIILSSQEFEDITEVALNSYMIKLGIRSMSTTFITAIVIGLFALWLIVRNIRKIVHVIRSFKAGDLSARVHLRGKTELSTFARAFNMMAATIESNIQKLKHQDQLRRDLAANVSHDLRTPLSIIRGYAETIKIKGEKMTKEKCVKYADLIMDCVDHLTSLVSELFELSKLEAGETSMKKENIDFIAFLNDLYHHYLIIFDQKSICFEMHTNGLPCFIEADPRLMRKVFQNLLDNAFQITPDHGRVSIILNKKDHRHYEVQIVDTGPGIDESKREFLFDRYYKDSSADNPGAGIGLSIVKKIIELHQFEISIDSRIGEGSAFKIVIPI